jgi:hypothetical protein
MLVCKLKGRYNSDDLVVDGRIILEQMLEKQNEKLWIDIILLRIGANGGLL